MNEQLTHILASTGYLHTEMVLFGGMVLLILLQSFSTRGKYIQTLPIYLLLAVLLLAFMVLQSQALSLFNGLLEITPQIAFGKTLVLLVAAIILLHLRVCGYNFRVEALILITGICFGLCFLLMANHLLSMFIAMEIVSLCSYVLVSFDKKANNLEAGIKYLIFGATATSIMLYGGSLLFGMTGTMYFTEMSTRLGSGANSTNLVQVALFLTLAGPLFKLAAAPFHIWAPDVYESTPTPLISFLAVAPKIGGLFILFKLLQVVPGNHTQLLSLIIFLSILIGNFAALSQKNAQRMMGYSGIAQSGFMLIGMLSVGILGFKTSLFYLAVYVFLNTGAFLLIDILSSISGSTAFESYAGMIRKQVYLGVLALVFMVGLTGIPPTAGFTAKFLVFTNLWESYSDSGQNVLLWILLFGLVNTAISIYFYFKIPYFMFLRNESGSDDNLKPGLASILLLSILAICVLAIFFRPDWVQAHLG